MAEWKIKRGDHEFTARDSEMLLEWAKNGRVIESDYVFNPVLDRWMYARDAAELAGVFTKKAAVTNKGIGCSVVLVGLLLSLIYLPLGILVGAAGLVMYAVAEQRAKAAG